MEILNPHYIHYKDSFLIFHSMAGKKKLEFWNLRFDLVTVRNVIGQGVDEMPRYVTVDTDHPASFRFADYRRGRIYEMDLEMLQEDTTTKHSLVYELPIKKEIPLSVSMKRGIIYLVSGCLAKDAYTRLIKEQIK